MSQEKHLSTANQVAAAAGNLIIRSESLKRVMRLAEKVARHPAAVLIVGETGTGKEMIAQSIHKHSLRCSHSMVDVNCAAIPEHLVESELFGYEKGAFSGADSLKPGFFELADKGTLFLDEIGDLDMKIQVKLLRVLDGAPYFRLGGSKKVSVDVRVVAATNRDLEDLVRAGRFRSDLYHRLAQFQLDVPPLRDRPDDVMGIAEQVLHEHYPESRFTADAMDALTSYPWPGNVRELRNIVFRAVLQAPNAQQEIAAEDLNLPETLPPDDASGVPLSGDLDQVERQAIFQALEKSNGNQGRAADALGISRRTLLRKLKTYRLLGMQPPAGTLSLSQQRYYRANLELPSRIKSAGEEFSCVILNLSMGGAGVKTEKPLKSGSSVALRFTIPGAKGETEIIGRVTWTNKEGHHGVQFNDPPAPVRTAIQRWLRTEMTKDGWELGSEE